MLMGVFCAPPLHSYLSFPHVLLCSDLLLVFIFSPLFGFTAKTHHMEQQMEGSEQKTVFGLAESTKMGSKYHRHTKPYHLCLTGPPAAAGGAWMPRWAL